MMKTKLLSILFATVMLLTCIPLGVASVSAEEHTEGVYTYTVADGAATITKYNGAGGAVVTPASLGGYPVTAIGNSAFSQHKYIYSVILSDGVTTIGFSAFFKCTGLEHITIPDSVTTIDDEAFIMCSSLTSVTIPNGVTTIGSYAFGYCISLSSVTIPDSVVTIEGSAFEGCGKLSSVTIPDSVITIGGGAFQNCTSLTSVTIPDSVTTIGSIAFSGCDSMTSVIISGSVTTIGDAAFWNCDSLTTVTIPVNVTISYDAFGNCNSLTDVYYAGTEEDRANVAVYDGNDLLLNATWHYNCINPKDHYSADVQHSVMDTEHGNGLAFKFELSASVGVKGKNKVDFTNATMNYLGKTCKLVGMGAVITNQENVIPSLDNINGKTVINISTVYLSDWELDFCAFAARIINIPNSALERTIYARPYYIVEVEGEQVIIYGDVNSAAASEFMA